MPAYIVLNVDVGDAERYRDYVAMAPVSIARYGGRFIARGGRAETLEGDAVAKRIVILEFPTYAQAKAWHASQEYAEARALRQAVSVGTMLLVDGVDVAGIVPEIPATPPATRGEAS